MRFGGLLSAKYVHRPLQIARRIVLTRGGIPTLEDGLIVSKASLAIENLSLSMLARSQSIEYL